MSAQHDHLVARLQAILSSLEAHDPEGAANVIDDAVSAFANTERPWADPRVMALFQTCKERAEAMRQSLHAELGKNATSRRAAVAYGDSP